MTVHCSPETSAAAAYGREPWLELNTVYSYQSNLFQPVLAESTRNPARPFVLIESTYEDEHDSTPDQIRRQAYWTMLGGGCGQFLGNNPIWHFDGPGLFPTKLTWVQALDATGSHDMTRLATFFRQLPWHLLIPEDNHAVVTEGYGKDTSTALTARTQDGKLCITYFPSTGTEAREFTVDTGAFPVPVVARWYNPTSGSFSKAEGAPLPNRGHQPLRTPGDNGEKANDWLLLLDAR
jgi:uncharacterized protein DUF4038/collagenase-like protein with putative collagen-binding domain